MSIPQLTFANSLIITDNYSETYESDIRYNHDNSNYERITDFIPFSLEPTDSYKYKDLIDYPGGKKIRMKYKLYPEDNYYVLLHSYEMVDSDGQLVTLTGTNYSHNNPTTEYRSIQYWSESEPGFDTFPFSECYYCTSHINYHQSGRVTVVGDPAVECYPCGRVFWKVSRPPVGGYTDFAKTQPTTTLTNSYNNAFVNIAVINSEAGFNEYFNLVDPDDEWHSEGDKPPAPDPSGTGGGDRPSDDGGDAVDFPTLPTTGVINTGLITLFNPSDAQLRNLAGVLWGNDFEQSIKKVLNDPFDGIIGLSMVPFTPTTSGSLNCEIGNFDTEISMPLVNAQYYTIDCGSVQIKENWGNALDYNSTIAEIFVPFVGFRPLDIQDIMGRTVALKYNVDILSGAAVAILKCGDKCLYEWPCNLSYNVPLTGSNKAALYTGLISVAMSGIGGLASGGVMGAVGGAATSAINTATHAQSNVQRGGSLASNTGVLGEFTPYIVLHRPKQSMPANFKNLKGYQSNITAQLSNCKGYTEVDYVHLTGISGATDTELQEIENLLKEGVII